MNKTTGVAVSLIILVIGLLFFIGIFYLEWNLPIIPPGDGNGTHPPAPVDIMVLSPIGTPSNPTTTVLIPNIQVKVVSQYDDEYCTTTSSRFTSPKLQLRPTVEYTIDAWANYGHMQKYLVMPSDLSASYTLVVWIVQVAPNQQYNIVDIQVRVLP